MNIKDIVMKDEKNTIFIEYESEEDFFNEILISAIALANSNGGKIICGLNKGGDAVFCPEILPSEIMDHIYWNTIPNILSAVENLCIPQNILYIEVYSKSEIVSSLTGKVYVRENFQAKYLFEDVDNIFLNEKNDCSSTVLHKTSLQDIDFMAVSVQRARLKALHQHSLLTKLGDLAFLKALGAIAEENNQVKFTLTGLLLFGNKKAVQEISPFIGIKYTLYLKHQKIRSCFIDEGNIIANINKGIKRIIQDTPCIKNSLYFEQNLFEALLNAYVHANYAKGPEVKIFNYDGNFEIVSSSGFINNISPSNILSRPPRQRNILLCRAIKKLHYSTFYGNGVKGIYERMLREGYEKPEYIATASRVKLLLKMRKQNPDFVEFLSSRKAVFPKEPSVYDFLILNHLYLYQTICLEEVMEITHLKQASAGKILKKFKELGLCD